MADVVPGPEALRIAAQQGKDPRHVQVVLDESREIVRAGRRVMIVETRHGFVCANAGVDASNVPGDEQLVLLPLDPDASARALRASLRELTGAAPGIIVTDSFGRAWRDRSVRRRDRLRRGRRRRGLARRSGRRRPGDARDRDRGRRRAGGRRGPRSAQGQRASRWSLIRGAERHVTDEDGPGVAPLVRARDQDLFR